MKRLPLSLILLSLAACDVEDDPFADAGVTGPDAPIETREDPVYRWVLVEDMSIEMNAFGAPGADICGIEFDCGDGLVGAGDRAILYAGDGDTCHEGEMVNGEPCFADRDDAFAAVGPPQTPCEADSSPSHYVALGVGGVLAVRLETADGDIATRGLAGCAITVHERISSDQEAYQISVCADAGGVACLQPAPLGEGPTGGEVRVVVPMQ